MGQSLTLPGVVAKKWRNLSRFVYIRYCQRQEDNHTRSEVAEFKAVVVRSGKNVVETVFVM